MFTMLLSLLLSTAHAQSCDAKALTAAVNEASPAGVGAALVRLHACSPEEARKVAPAAVTRMVDAENIDQALLVGIRAGAWDAARDWLGRQEPDIRSRMVVRIGSSCATAPAVGEFLIDAAGRDAARFWQERWHKGLAECRTEGARRLLTEALTGPHVGRDSRNRTGFQSLLEVYARNLGAEAIPTLATLLAEAKDEDSATMLVVVFADAANVGGQGGTNTAAAKAAIDAIVAAAPKLPGRALERARGTLTALGDEAAAASLAKHRWADRYVDGAYTWGLAAVEQITCKNAEERAVLHIGSLREPGSTWPDGIGALAEKAAKGSWKLDGAAKCKGTGEVKVLASEEPLGADALGKWIEAQKTAFTEANAGKKISVVDEAVVTP